MIPLKRKMSDARSPSPEIYSSDNEDPQELLRNWVNELRPPSPESIASQDEFRSLSPDSPVPQFIPHYCEYDVEYSANRSCSPVSAASDWDYNDLCLEYLFEEIRPDSPVSVLSDFELEYLFNSSRPLSPESVSSDLDCSLVQNWLADLRPSSPESVTSVEQHCVCSNIPLAHLSINIVTITCDTLKGDPHHLSQWHQTQRFVAIALKSFLMKTD